MKKTKIEWCDSTWNPVTGCFHGCDYCYARGIANRFSAGGENIRPDTMAELNEPLIANGIATAYPYGFQPTLYRYRLGEYANKKGRTIFVCSTADLFGDWVPDSWIEEVFEACERAPQHRYLFLTKNPGRYMELAERGKLPERENMWYGSTTPTPDTEFYYSMSRNIFVSVEPILENFCGKVANNNPVDWIIIGAETGKRKGKIVPDSEWITDILKMARRNNVPVFMKDSLIPIVGEENMIREFPWDMLSTHLEKLPE